MTHRLLLTAAVVVLCLTLTVPSFAQSGTSPLAGVPSKGQVTGIIVGIVAVAAVLGYVVYRSTHRHDSIAGCLASGSIGLTLADENKHTFPLTGDTADLKPGERVALQGKKHKDDFEVQKLTKNFGQCTP
jgi:hypothetical protein